MVWRANNPVDSVQRCLDVIDELRTLETARIRDLEDRLDMTKSAIHNHLSTLRERGYVLKDDDEYRLGLKFLAVGGEVRGRRPVYRAARDEVDRVAAETGELGTLVCREYATAVTLYVARGEDAASAPTLVGQRRHLHNTASGKAILAHLDPERVRDVVETNGLPATTERTITDSAALFEALGTIRDRGVAVDDEEWRRGIAAVAAPVLDPDGRVLGAVGVTAPASRVDDAFRDRVATLLDGASNVAELELQYA